MDIQSHARTSQIKQLSRYLYMALNVLRFIFYLGWVAILIICFLPGGEFYLGDAKIQLNSEKFEPIKAVIVICYATGLFIMIRLAHFFRMLMKQYMHGHIFSEQAILYVKGAIKYGIIFMIASWIQSLLGSLYLYQISDTFQLNFTSEIFFALIYFGSMYTLLWALEIGCDLNEESEKTI